ncbi:uncharacterized protein HMPREF1541_03662 [Cyphellophora europaea CBS 101466]|uniref:Ion transport domain-containing protein n=1 Tax=Cyphellophora europaea (strain CBS 101466) TaxID=1220924 RepID=W2RYZ4_CYPE1|nr:uncharacterized protein HMPREF1541_03662 [Cyphellophora europaea CBS 101466]ETN41726.1 hypothetical protein HMPREF1541_03662 [Cyphellophora europaea CBS 101466]
MFSSLLRSRSQRRRSRVDRPTSPSTERRPFSAFGRLPRASFPRSYASYDDDEHSGEEEDEEEDLEPEDEGDEDDEGDENESSSPLLPIFSSATLDAVPVFSLTHIIREMVVSRCETVLSWDQLRSPQVSQFLVRPILQQITSSHFNAATEYALLANCLQFSKEAAINPANSGTSKTRAMLCELLAIRLLRDYSTRELIDALSYDFDPLQGQVEAAAVTINGNPTTVQRRVPPRVARISCYEVALRAQAKRFLAHPTVVQQLEAIWAGSIVFHSAADSMHRKLPSNRQPPGYGTIDAIKHEDPDTASLRRAVTIYNPRDASLLKLSRLRVPRYRNILSTLSFAVLLGLFLAVLIQRSLEITTLEVIFWFWAGGYMLDEVVGFNEQGFSLYIASFWNTFDLGILALLFIHLCLRFYGIAIADVRKHTIANMAYDVLAADAILLFPRLFSVLDHYKYFSQLLIAFRMMAQDLIAILVLILVSCSGFFVALTLAFGEDNLDTPGNVAYALLQILMGFTPAAWDRWGSYNTLGKIILTLFLFIAHFLIVVILITVLTNSFMAIVQNANEEHQYVFAVNTIASVKSDALFSYVAPTNILQWLLTPLRYFVPFRQYVKINRTIIKVTHFPILFSIYLYERTFLGSSVYDSMDLVESRGRPKRPYAPKLPRLAREPSIATFRQDRALEEVFRALPDSTRRQDPSRDRRQTSTAVNNWMKDMGDDLASPPPEQDRKVVDRLERQRTPGQWKRSFRARQASRRTISVVSDPEDFRSITDMFSPGQNVITEEITPSHVEGPSQQTDADGDDELAPDEEHDEMDQSTHLTDSPEMSRPKLQPSIDYFARQGSPRTRTPKKMSPVESRKGTSDGESNLPVTRSPKQAPRYHFRNFSTATQIYKPESSSEATDPTAAKTQPYNSGTASPINKSASSGITAAVAAGPSGRKTPKRPARVMRPILPTKDNPAFRSAPTLAGIMTPTRAAGRGETRERPNAHMDIVSDIGDNQAIGGGYVGAIPASFATQMFQASRGDRERKSRDDEQERMARLMMARLTNLEESMREVIHGVREVANVSNSGPSRNRSPERALPRVVKRNTGPRDKAKEGDKTKEGGKGPENEVERPDTAVNVMNKENFDPRELIAAVETAPRTPEDQGSPGPTLAQQNQTSIEDFARVEDSPPTVKGGE